MMASRILWLAVAIWTLPACNQAQPAAPRTDDEIVVQGTVLEANLTVFADDCGHGDLFRNTFTFFGFPENRLLGATQPLEMIERRQGGGLCQTAQPYRITLPASLCTRWRSTAWTALEMIGPDLSSQTLDDLIANDFTWDVLVRYSRVLPNEARIVCEGLCGSVPAALGSDG
jgi:hypothetical protein